MQPVEATKTHARRHWTLYFLALVAMLSLSPAIWSAGLHFGPRIQGPAIARMEVVWWRCDRHDLIIELRIVKRHGQFDGLTVEAIESQGIRPLRWRPMYSDYGPQRMTAGLPSLGAPQTVGPMMIEFGCGRSFTIHTRHESAIGWWHLTSDFGPFGPYGEPPELSISDLLKGKYPPPVQAPPPAQVPK